MGSNIDDELIERILLDLKNVFKKDPLSDEFDILPVHESIRNKSPVIHVNNKLALEVWCVKPFYTYVHNKFFSWKLKKIKADSDTVLSWTCAILLINPEIKTAWNTRKELFNDIYSRSISKELQFSELVLSRKPRCCPVFAYRKWVLLKLKEKCIDPEVIKQELIVCFRAANLYPNNYYAWSHRSWILQELLDTCSKSVIEELERTESWVTTHISDHSGFHYRQFLLSCYRTFVPKLGCSHCWLHYPSNIIEENEVEKCFFPSTKIFQEAIYKEIVFLSSLQATYLGHETLWYHRRFLLHEIKLMAENKAAVANPQQESLDEAVQSKKHKLESNCVASWDIAKEENFIKHHIDSYGNKSWERTLLIRHLKWLNNILKWSLSISFC